MASFAYNSDSDSDLEVDVDEDAVAALPAPVAQEHSKAEILSRIKLLTEELKLNYGRLIELERRDHPVIHLAEEGGGYTLNRPAMVVTTTFQPMTNNVGTATLTCNDDQEIPDVIKLCVNNSMDLLNNSAPLGSLEQHIYEEEVQKKKKRKTSRAQKAKYAMTMGD